MREAEGLCVNSDTGLKMNQQSGHRARQIQPALLGAPERRVGGTLSPSSPPHTFPNPNRPRILSPIFWPLCPAPPIPALPAISQASCYSFLYSKWDGVLVSLPSPEKLPTQILANGLPPKEVGNTGLFLPTGDYSFPKFHDSG